MERLYRKDIGQQLKKGIRKLLAGQIKSSRASRPSCFLILNELLLQYFICLSVVLHAGDNSGHKGQLDSRKCTDPARKKKLRPCEKCLHHLSALTCTSHLHSISNTNYTIK